jgi:predicted O-methyltransferase YrrM
VRERPECLDAEMHPDERALLQRMTSEHVSEGGLLEVGTAAGGSLVLMLDALRESGRGGVRVVSLDHMRYFENQHSVIRENLASHGHDPDGVEFWIGKTPKILRGYSGPAFDMILVDANHTYKHCTIDSQWIRHLRADGVILFHDYHPPFPGVIRAVDELCQRNPHLRIVERAQSLLAIQRDTSLAPTKLGREVRKVDVLRATVLTALSRLLRKLGLDYPNLG